MLNSELLPDVHMTGRTGTTPHQPRAMLELCFETKALVLCQLQTFRNTKMSYYKQYNAPKRPRAAVAACGTCKMKLGINSNCAECIGTNDPMYAAKKQQHTGPKSSTQAMPSIPGSLPMYASVFITSVTRIGAILKVAHGNVANGFMYDVESNATDEFDVEEIVQQRQIDMFQFIGAHSKDAKNWPEDAFEELEVVHCKDGLPAGGGRMHRGMGTVTGVALYWFGSPCYNEVTMRDDPPGKYYFERQCV